MCVLCVGEKKRDGRIGTDWFRVKDNKYPNSFLNFQDALFFNALSLSLSLSFSRNTCMYINTRKHAHMHT